MTRTLLTFTVFTIFITSISCKKSNTSTGGSGDKTVAGLSGSYKLTAQTLSTDGVVVDEYATYDACEKDDIAKLNTDLTYQTVDAGVVCDPPGNTNGNWNLSSNSDSLIIDGSSQFIESWNGKTLVLTEKASSSGHTLIATTTLVRQ